MNFLSRYLITGSSGSKYVKVWKINQQGSDLESTEVKELQILRDHTDYLSVIKVGLTFERNRIRNPKQIVMYSFAFLKQQKNVLFFSIQSSLIKMVRYFTVDFKANKAFLSN